MNPIAYEKILYSHIPGNAFPSTTFYWRDWNINSPLQKFYNMENKKLEIQSYKYQERDLFDEITIFKYIYSFHISGQRI